MSRMRRARAAALPMARDRIIARVVSLAIAIGAHASSATGCGEEPPPPVTGTFVLADGTSIAVANGEVALFDGERALVALHARGPVARTFDETTRGDLGIYEFRRRDEVTSAFSRISSAREEAGRVVIEYAAEDTAASEGAPALLLTLAPGARPGTTALSIELRGAAYDSLALPVRCDADGSFHGFGEQYDATDHRGEELTLVVSEQGIGRTGGAGRFLAGDRHTTYFPMPYYLDARGFGLLLHTEHRVEVDACATDPEIAWLEVVSGETLSAIIFHGPTPLDVVRALGEEVGRPRRPPDWAFAAPWISIQGGQDIVLAEADALDAAGVPYAALWSQDWTGLRMNFGGGFGVQYRWVVDAELYPDLRGLTDALHARGVRFLAYANPFVDMALADHYPDMAARDLLIRDASGAPYAFFAPNGMSSHPDFTREEARAYVRDALADIVTRHGVDGWMADFGEWTPFDAVLSDGSDPRAFHNRFPIEWHRANREAMDAVRPDGDYVLFARSGWSGVQRHSMIHWVGDQEANWSETDGLPTVVPAMLSLGLAGVPFVTHDIGGFSGGPSTKELYQRWVELGAFTPIMRTHEGNERDVNWNWDGDAETIAHFARFARVHQALAPELRALADEAARDGTPMVRHLMLVFPDDPEAARVSDAYMLGDGLLVAPVTAEGATTRELYLPEGEWFHVFSGERFTGPSRITVDAPIGTPPVFARASDRPDLRAID